MIYVAMRTRPLKNNKKTSQLTTSQFLVLEYGRAIFVGGSSTGAAVAAELASDAATAAGRAAGVAVSSSSGQSAGDFFVSVISS